MKRTTQKILETPNLENDISILTTQEERATSPSPTSQFSLETKGKQPTTTPQTTPKLAQTLGISSEILMETSTNLEIDQQEAETRTQPPDTFEEACVSTDPHMHNQAASHAAVNTNQAAHHAAPNTNQKNSQKKSWSGLFTQKERGPSTFKVSATARGPKSKNENAIIISIMALHDVESNIILKALHEKYAKILLGAKFKFTKNGRTHLELIFHSYEEMEIQLARGIDLLGQNFRGYFASAANRTYLNITLRNMPIYNKQVLSDLLFETFEGICPIASIKPLIYTSTQFLSDQWMVSLDITDRESIVSKIPRVTNIRNHKVSLYWKNAPALCHFCGNEGHFRKNCLELEEANKGRLLLEQLKKEQQQQREQQQQEEQQQQQKQQQQQQMETVETSDEKEVDPVQIDIGNNPFLETVKTPSVMEDPQTKTSDAGLFLDTEAETSSNEESEMDSSANHPPGFEDTPPQAETSLGKRTDHPSTSQEEIRKPRPNKGKQRKQNTQRQAKRLK
jgi:hypothetical protein